MNTPFPRKSDDSVKFETAAAIQRGELPSDDMLIDASSDVIGGSVASLTLADGSY
jgi:hypothetical protein